MENPLTNIFEKEGTHSVIGGNTPFLLDDPDSIWYIQSGQVEVFSVSVNEKQPTGARYHFFTARPGDILLGIDIETLGMGVGFLAVGLIGTNIYKINFNRFRELAEMPDLTPHAARLLERWIEGLSYGISKDINTRTDLLLQPDKEVTIDDGKIVRSKKGIMWISIAEGETLFIGMEEVKFDGQKTLIPISQDTWLQSIGSVKLSIDNTENALMSREVWQSMENLYSLLLQCAFMNVRLAEVDEFNRLKSKANCETLAIEGAVSQLASVLKTTDSSDSFTGDLEDMLFMSVWHVGQALEITVKTPPKSKQIIVKIDPLDAICNASQIKKRLVKLKDNWWRRDCGPLLAFYNDTEQPVALLPSSSRSYELYDPRKQERIPVNSEIASSIKSVGFTFYRSFPDKPLTGLNILNFSLFGLRKDIVTIIIVGIAGSLLGLLTPWATGVIFDTIIPGAERVQMMSVALALFMSAFGIVVFEFTRNIAFLRIEGRLDGSLQSALIDRLLNLTTRFFRQYSVGDLAMRVMAVSQIRRALSDVVVTGLLSGIFSIFYIGQMFYYHRKLAWMACGLIFLNIIITFLLGFFALRYKRQIFDIQGKISAMVLQFLTGISKLRVAGAESHAFAKWAQEFTHQRNLSFKESNIQNINTVFNSVFNPLLTNIAIYILFVYILYKAAIEKNPDFTILSTGAFLAFNAAFGIFLASMMGMTQSFLTVVTIVPLWERARPVFEAKPEYDEALVHPGELAGRLQVDHITFSYTSDGPVILKDVSFNANPGEFIALVGPSGSGKSTLIRLLLGFEKPDIGTVYYDEHDLSLIDKRSLRQQIGVVLQNSILLSGDIFTNIIGASLKTMDDAWEAARMAGLDEDIKQMPMGMHTVISQGGSTLSGGQRQRLLIARAMVQRPGLIYFDEATSALDNRTQAIVTESLDKLRATRIVIAHRLSTIINADKIFVLDSGRVVQSGNYEELSNQEGLFAELVKRQIA